MFSCEYFEIFKTANLKRIKKLEYRFLDQKQPFAAPDLKNDIPVF